MNEQRKKEEEEEEVELRRRRRRREKSSARFLKSGKSHRGGRERGEDCQNHRSGSIQEEVVLLLLLPLSIHLSLSLPLSSFVRGQETEK